MDQLKRLVLLLPSGIAFGYAVYIAIWGLYFGFFAPSEALQTHGFNPQAAEWRLRSAGHYFWYAFAVSLVFSLFGVVLKRLLGTPPDRSRGDGQEAN